MNRPIHIFTFAKKSEVGTSHETRRFHTRVADEK